MNDVLERLLSANHGASSTPESMIFAILLVFTIGQFIGWVYIWTHGTLSYSQGFVASLVVIPSIVTLLMLLMSTSIVIAFGFLTVFAVVRFRNAVKDTRDTTFLLWAIIEGMSVGTMRYSTAVLGVAIISLIMIYMRVTSFGKRYNYDAVLTLQIISDLDDATKALKRILWRHAARRQLAGARTDATGGMDLSYRLLLRDPSRIDDLRLELESAEGIDQVSLYAREDESEI